MIKEPEALVRKANSCFASPERQNAEPIWSILSEFLVPNQSGVFLSTGQETPGASRTNRLYDSTPIMANLDLASAIHATLTNPATKWSKIRLKREDLNNNEEVNEWMEEVNNIIHERLNESNFDRQLSKGYKLFTSIATMPILHEAKREDGVFSGFKFTALHLSEIAIEENAEGDIDTLYRRFKLTARQAVQRWGDKVGEKIKEAVETKPQEKFKFLHAIYPRKKNEIKEDSNGLSVPSKRPYASVYVDVSTNDVVEEGGFYEFPVYVPRWDTLPGEVYGRGPGHNALPDIRTLNRLKDIMLHSLAQAARPPLLTTMRNVLGNLDLRPGSLTVVRDPQGIKEMVTQARFDVTQLNVQELQNSIKSAFFIDKLMLPPRDETGEMTAFEIQRRLEQMQRVLGPTISRFSSEFLSPLIVRTFKILLREQALPPMPQVLVDEGIDVEIVFINQLSRAQQMDSINNIQQWINDMGGLAQLKPEVLDYIDADGIAKHIAKTRGVPASAVTNDDVVEQAREARAQQQQAAQALEAGVKAADIAAKSQTAGGDDDPNIS